MRAAHKIGDRRPGLHRKAVGEPGDAHHPRIGLDGQIHRQIVPVRAAQSIPGARPIDQPRIDPRQALVAELEPVHHPRREVLDQDVGAAYHVAQQPFAVTVLRTAVTN